jgi:peroxiredoxin
MLLQSDGPDFGQAAPDFALQDAEGHSFRLRDVSGENGVLVAFICNHCPYVVDIMPRLVMDIPALDAAGIGVVCINANDPAAYPADAPAKMPGFAAKFGLQVPYLVDADQSVARAYGAVCTPDFFGFGHDAGLQYRGRLDDVAMRSDPAGRKPELLEAMESVARTGKAPQVQTPSIGCSIKWA